MMKHFWALPVILRTVLASQGSFSVLDDLLAFPQYQVVFTDSGISEEHAASLHAASKQHGASPTTVELSQQTRADDDSTNNAASNPFARGDKANDDAGDEDELAATYSRMVLHSQPYLCRIPIVDTSSNNGTANGTAMSKAEEEKELMRASDRGWELLKGMQGNCIYFLSGWWSYSFCYNEGVKQFHQLPPTRGVPIYPPVEDESVSSYILGTFPGEGEPKEKKRGSDGGDDETDEIVDDEGNEAPADSDREETSIARLETKGETRYLVQKLTGGTICDLTGKERKIEVQFHCHPNTPDRIGMIKEVATCSYLMVIYTPRLCNDVAFLPPQENRAHSISCAPILDSADAALPSSTPRHPHHRDSSTLGAKAQHADDEKPSAETDIELPAALLAAAGIGTGGAADSKATSKPLPTIGGTVVGAKQLVGQPGSVIEKSVVVGGGKEVVLGTVASSDGRGRDRVMSAEELRKLDIKDPKDVEDLRRKLGKLAGPRQAWRLELVDTPRGREFRGIIDNDDGDDEDAQEGSEKREGAKKGDGKGGKKEVGNGEGGGEEGYEEGEWYDEAEWVEVEWYDDEELGDEEGSEETFFREEL